MIKKNTTAKRYLGLACIGLMLMQADIAWAHELSVQIAMQVLIEAKAVEFGGGEQFYEPTPILSVKLLLGSPQAAEIFREVYRRSLGSPGKVYALIGLDRLGDPEFEPLRLDFLRSSPGPVTYVNGCSVLHDADPRDFLKEWLEFARGYRELKEVVPVK